MPRKSNTAVVTIGIDPGKNTLHLVGLDARGGIVLREKVARARIISWLANVPRCLIGIEAGMGTHYVTRELLALGHDVRQVPPVYAKPFRQTHKNDFRDAQMSVSIRATRIGGTIAFIGVLAGPPPAELRLPLMVLQQQRLQGVTVGSVDDLQAMCDAIDINEMRPVIDKMFPFDQVAEAFRHMVYCSGQRSVTGAREHRCWFGHHCPAGSKVLIHTCDVLNPERPQPPPLGAFL
jgi:hypothetical protein